MVVSDLLDVELLNALARVRDLLSNFPPAHFERVELTQEAADLADRYVSERVVGKTSLIGCQYIALATVSRVDVLASWNFKHIVNLEPIKGYDFVNLRLGYPLLEISSPQNLITYGSD